MDTIELSIGISSFVQDNEVNYILHPVCKINDKTIKATLDLYALFDTHDASAEIFTCSCGVAGCAGIFDKIFVKIDDDKVDWFIPRDDDSYSFLDKNVYSFNKEFYYDEINKAMKVLRDMSKFDLPVHDQFSHFHGDQYLLKNKIESYEKIF